MPWQWSQNTDTVFHQIPQTGVWSCVAHLWKEGWCQCCGRGATAKELAVLLPSPSPRFLSDSSGKSLHRHSREAEADPYAYLHTGVLQQDFSGKAQREGLQQGIQGTPAVEPCSFLAQPKRSQRQEQVCPLFPPPWNSLVSSDLGQIKK